MSNSISKIHNPYYSFLHKKNKDVIEDTYYNSKDFEYSKLIEDNWKIILEETMNFANENKKALKPYFATDMMNAPEKWKAFSFYFWGVRMSEKAIQNCPRTIQLLEQIPNILSASISVLEPQSEIKPHYGDTDSIYRFHLGLVVPEQMPTCGFRVGYEDRSWEEGKLLVFNDAAYHKAWNKSDKRRVILLFDVLKPEYEKNKMWICARVRGNVVWQAMSQATGIFKGKTNGFTKTICWINAILAWCWLQSLNRKSSWL